MTNGVRVIVVLGLLTAIGGTVILSRKEEGRPDRAGGQQRESAFSSKRIGSSALSHGGPIATSRKETIDTNGSTQIKPGQKVAIVGRAANGTKREGKSSSLITREEDSSVEVLVMNVESRPVSQGRMQQFFEVQFADGRKAWVHEEAIRESPSDVKMGIGGEAIDMRGSE